MFNQTLINRIPWLTIWLGLLSIGLGTALGLGVSLLGRPAYAIAGLLGAIVALICVINAEAGLYILVVITYLRISDVLVKFYGAPSIAKPFIALMIGVVFLNWLFREAPPRNTLKTILLVLTYGLVTSLSMYYAADPSAVADALDEFWKNGVIAILVVVLLRNGRALRNVIWFLILTGIFMGTISVWQYVTGTFDNTYGGFGIASVKNIAGSTSGYRVSGPIGDPNFFAQIMLVIVPLAFGRFLEEKNTVLKVLALWATLVTLLTVVFTFSRGAFLAMVLMAVLLFYFHPPKPREVLSFLAVLLLLGLQFVPEGYMARVLTLNDLFGGRVSVQGEVSFRGRASEYAAAWMMFADHPILGVGVNNYDTYYQEYSRQIGLDPRSESRSAHSFYLETAAELGLTGIAVLFITLLAVFRSIKRSWNQLRNAGDKVYSEMVLSVGIGFVGYLTAAVFIHDAYPRYFWLLVGIGLALPEVATRVVASGLGDNGGLKNELGEAG
jgi:putative inorganic carbon (hco3(-)) transporter